MKYGELPAEVSQLRRAMEELPEFQNISYRHAFEGFMKKMEQIDTLYSVDKYRIVFIGEPGKGKTTAICNWLDILKKNKENEKRIENISLLATASGRTTVAEVHIRQIMEGSRIRIEYMSLEQQKEYIKEYCNYYYSRCFNVEEDDTDDSNDAGSGEVVANVHLEIDRVIRNMASIENLPSGTGERSKEKRDRILAFMRQFEDADAFFGYVLDRIDLESRNCPVITYTGEIPFEDWLSSIFKEVNDGKRPDCSIASKIYVDISDKDLFLDLPEYIEEIVDTIGLDSSVRTDLQELMLAPNTICFLLDDLKSVPSPNVRNLIKGTFLSEWDQYYSKKTSIFVKSSANELAAVNEADGDPDVGIEIKANELERRIDADKIPYRMENTLFLDSCAAYIYKSEKTIEMDEYGNPVINKITGKPKVNISQIIERFETEVALEYRKDVTHKIERIISDLKSLLQKDADGIRDEVQTLIEVERKFENADADNELIEVKEKLVEKRSAIVPRFRGKNIIEAILRKTIDIIHWRTIQKMNSLYGGYEVWHTDIYTQIMQAGKECFSNTIRPESAKIREILVDVRNEDARSITAGYLKQYELMVKKSTDKLGKSFLRWALDDAFAPQSSSNAFWKEVNAMSGRGYKSRVRAKYEENIYDDGRMLAEMITTEVEKILDDLIALFPED